jgi:L-fucose isomerase-like protein
MKNITIGVLPVGELDTDLVKGEYAALLKALEGLDCELISVASVSDMESARQFVREMSQRNPDLLAIIPLRGLSAEIIEVAALVSSVPCVILPVHGRYALPSSALAIGSLQGSGLPIELLYASPEHPEFIEKLHRLVRVASAYSQIKKSRIGIIGGLFPNLVSCRYDTPILSSRLGVTFYPISFEEMRNSVKAASRRVDEIGQSQREITGSYEIDPAYRNALISGIHLHLALKRIAQEQKIDGFATECWSAFPRELGLNPCLGFIEDAYTLACEGDVLLCIALLAVRYLTGSRAYVGDLYDLDMDRVLTLIHCGAPVSLSRNKKDVVLEKSQLALERGFETLTCCPWLEQGPVTLLRFYGSGCDKLHLAAGELTGCEQSPNLTVHIRLDGNRWDFLEQCFGNHYVVAAGDIRSELKLLCKWLEIEIFET